MTNDSNQPPSQPPPQPPYNPNQPPVAPQNYASNTPQYSQQYAFQQPNMQVDANGYPIGYPPPTKKGFPIWIPLVIVGLALIGVAVWLFVSNNANNQGPTQDAREILSDSAMFWATQEEIGDYDGWGVWITTNENCTTSQMKINIYEDEEVGPPAKVLNIDSGEFVKGTEKLVKFTEPEGYEWAEPIELWCSK